MKKNKKRPGRKEKADRGTVFGRVLLKKLLQNIDAYVMITDSRGRIVFVNKKYADFFRFSQKKIIGEYWIDSVIPESKRRVIQRIFSDIKNKKVLIRFDSPVLAGRKPEKCLCWIGVPLEEKRFSFYLFMGRQVKCRSDCAVKVHTSTSRTLDKAYREVIDALFAASKISEPGTAEHAIRAMSFAIALAKKLKIGKRRIKTLKIACLLHDLGKLVVDEDILFKKGRLNKREFAQIKKHPHWGSEVVNLVYFLRDIIPIIIHHHENYNGSGYPAGVKGDKIPLEARILSVADVYEALTADRPYRKGFSSKEAAAIMEGEKGQKLDPKLTDIFLDMVRKGKFKGTNR